MPKQPKPFYTLKDKGRRALDAYWFICDGYMASTEKEAGVMRKRTDAGTEVVKVLVTVEEVK